MDPAILAAFEFPLPPAQPPMVEERIWQSPGAQKLERYARQQILSYERYVGDWAGRLDQIRQNFPLAEIVHSAAAHLDELDGMISEVEAIAKDRAIAIHRFQKLSRRRIKSAFALDPSIGAVLRTMHGELQKLDEKIIEELLDYALWLRAIRATVAPAASTGVMFDDPKSLADYLQRETA